MVFKSFQIAIAILWLIYGQISIALVLSPNLEIKRIANVGSTWQTVSLSNSYSSAVVVCTYNLPNKNDPSATVRVRNVGATSFQLRIQQFENSNTVAASDVHCIIADEGAYNSGGLKFEAHRVLSTGTSGLSVPGGWGSANTQEITGSLSQSYTSPVVLGQVMSFNDVKASVFWTYNCVDRNRRPFDVNNRACVGKHIGQINASRASETLGYFVIESGSGSINDIAFEAAVGSNSIAGIGNSPPYSYAVGGDYDIGVANQAGENGGHGGWAVLYGSDPVSSGQLALGIEEEVVAGDKTRTHTNEEVGYWLFKDNQTVNLSTNKTVTMSNQSPSPYAIPGSDVLYTIHVSNTGSKSVDANTIFIADKMPAQASFYNGDLNGPAAGSNVVIFSETGSGLSFNPATDLAFSNGATAPANFLACNYTPAVGYDPNVTFICLKLQGALNAGSLSPSNFSLQFRAQVQ